MTKKDKKHIKKTKKQPKKAVLCDLTAEIKLAATAGKSVAEIEKSLKIADFNKLLDLNPELKAAFERGRFLRNIAEFGGKNYTIPEAGGELGLKSGELDKIFATDFEAADIWNQSRLQTLLAIKSKWLEMVGMASPAALKQLEKLMSRGIVQPAADLTHITSKQLQELTRRSRQTVEYEWPKTHGLVRNSDATYNLYVFFPWFEEFVVRTRIGTSPKQSESAATAEKARKYKMENDERQGRLLPRDKVIAGLTARMQTTLRIFYKALIEQKDPYIKQTLERAFEEIRRELAAVPPELKLSEEQTEKMKELLNDVSATDFTDDFKNNIATETAETTEKN